MNRKMAGVAGGPATIHSVQRVVIERTRAKQCPEIKQKNGENFYGGDEVRHRTGRNLASI